jgi:hypothetical protein
MHQVGATGMQEEDEVLRVPTPCSEIFLCSASALQAKMYLLDVSAADVIYVDVDEFKILSEPHFVTVIVLYFLHFIKILMYSVLICI